MSELDPSINDSNNLELNLSYKWKAAPLRSSIAKEPKKHLTIIIPSGLMTVIKSMNKDTVNPLMISMLIKRKYIRKLVQVYLQMHGKATIAVFSLTDKQDQEKVIQ